MTLKYMIGLLALVTYTIAPAHPISCTKTNTVIAFDVDGVLCKRDKKATFKMLFKYPKQLKRFYKINKQRNKNVQHSGYNDNEKIYLDCCNQKEMKTARAIRKITGAKKLKKSTLKLCTNLHAKGFTMVTATNIGSVFFADLQRKFPQVFNKRFLQKGMTVDYAAQEVIKKPDSRYFDQLKAIVKHDSIEHIIFIDDTLENVNAARKNGLIAIHFKNAEQLKRDLARYNIHI